MYTEIVVRVSDPYDAVNPQKVIDVLQQILGYHVVADEKGRLARVIGTK